MMSSVTNKSSTMSLLNTSDSSQRNLGNGHHSITSSPLKLFGQARKKINDVFNSIAEYITDGESFLKDLSTMPTLSAESESYLNVIKGFRGKVDGIGEVLGRDHMKVAFFGRTSNGKSSTINAMLKDKILPSGIGHTTNCFLQVEGTDQSDAYILTENSHEPQNMSNIKQLASALSSYKLSSNSLIRIMWPKEKCRLLREDVILVDSPGIDVTPDLDLWIDKFCLDADVFVLVANAESTLMQTEKNFFHKVSERLSKPNVFVLMNRWDMSAQEEDIDEVREQHLQRNIQFLVDELKVVARSQAENRIFFVSAKEAMLSRLHEDKGTPTPIGTLADGFQGRLFEFANFESQFETCISKSAVKTKFEQHTECGKAITTEARTIMDEIYGKTLALKNNKYQEKQEKMDELDNTEKQLNILTEEIKEKIQCLSDEVERKVSQSLREEITRLSLVIEQFDEPFNPDSKALETYKKRLHSYVEHGLDSNMQSRCSLSLSRTVQQSQQDMTERLSSLMTEEARTTMSHHTPQRQFEVSYQLNCQNLCSDFKEDLSFRFTLGFSSLMRRFFGNNLRASVDSMKNPLPQWPSNAFLFFHAWVLGETGGDRRSFDMDTGSHGDNVQRRTETDLLLTVLPTMASLTSRATIGGVVVTCLVAKTAGWRIIAITGGLYGLVYLYERLTWTTRAKERAFKKQYADYAASKLKLVVDLTSTNCCHQVKNELTTSFAQLNHHNSLSKSKLEDEIKFGIAVTMDCSMRDPELKLELTTSFAQLNHHISLSKSKLEDQIQDLESETQKLGDIGNCAKILRNKADWLDGELNGFINQYLNDST